MKAAFIFLAAALCAGCVTGMTTHVLPAGNGTFVISASGGMYEERIAPIMQRVYDSANSYCTNSHQTMEVVSSHEEPYALGHNVASFSLTFKCAA